MLRLLPRKPVRIDLTDSGEFDAPNPMSLPRRHVMDQIITLNPSATADFLEQFDDAALEQYLQHLIAAQQPRGRDARWVRTGRRPWASMAAACA